ncbi:Hydrogenase isoenzymes formation protein HypE [Phycisphaerae bacterium RAS1]|nr:Hydrogenase isoenzymes formation protein HypE [Phycisphaerae bacterium RAS1]
MTTAVASQTECVMLAHGGGGELMHRLIRDRLLTALRSVGPPRPAAHASNVPRAVGHRGPTLRRESCPAHTVSRGVLTDGAVLPWTADNIVFTTDSYVVTPIEFPGGDIGRLAVCGTVNDLTVMGAQPVAISLGLILEEGLPLETLDRVMRSVAGAAREGGVEIVTGDTKVIERRGSPPELFINTAGIGRLRDGVQLGAEHIEPGDCILINGPIAEHGLAIMSVRNGVEFETPLRSDAAPLNHLIADLLDIGASVKFLRDPTRGGVAGVLADICDDTGLSIEIDETRLPLSPAARYASEMLGIEPLTFANEGKVICVVAAADCEKSLSALRTNPLGRHAACIGSICDRHPALVELTTRYGGRRIVQRSYGEDLPRIC